MYFHNDGKRAPSQAMLFYCHNEDALVIELQEIQEDEKTWQPKFSKQIALNHSYKPKPPLHEQVELAEHVEKINIQHI